MEKKWLNWQANIQENLRGEINDGIRSTTLCNGPDVVDVVAVLCNANTRRCAYHHHQSLWIHS